MKDKMAQFVRLWESRGAVIAELEAAAREADACRDEEYRAAVVIQSWLRGCRVRAYLAHLSSSALTLQRNYRAYLGRCKYRERLRECLDDMRRQYYHTMAVRIQCAWRGYHIRKYEFDYYAQKNYLEGLVITNNIVRAKLSAYWERVEQNRLAREDQLQELQTTEEAKRLHYMLSTQCKDGVFKTTKTNSFERRMKATQFSSSRQSSKKKPRTLTSEAPPTKTTDSLPPLVLGSKVQGPFRAHGEVWRQRTKPLSPSLRVATDFNSQEIARAELKVQEWRSRIIDEKFLPFSRREHRYQPLLHTHSSYARLPYGSRQFRDEDDARDIAPQTFRTVVPPIPQFDKLNSTY